MGRDYDSIERTVLGQWRGGRQTAADLIRTCRELARAGVQQTIISIVARDEPAAVETLGREVVPALAPL